MLEDDENDDDEDYEDWAMLFLEEALAWVATRNTAFVQTVAASGHSSSFDLNSLAMRNGVEMAFAASSLKAWEILRRSISTGQIQASGLWVELTRDYEPGSGIPDRPERPPRVDLPPGLAKNLELVEGEGMSLRPRELGFPAMWWFEVKIRFKQIKTIFPVEAPPILAKEPEKRKKAAPQLEFARKILQQLYPDAPPQIGISLAKLREQVAKTGGPQSEDPAARKNFEISSKTVGRAAEELWPGWPYKLRS